MKRHILYTCLFIVTILAFRAQTYNNPGGTISTCSGTFYDGNGTSNYTNNNNTTTTFCSSSGNCVQVVFTTFQTESGTDILTIYDGPNTSSPVIGNYSGTSSPGTVISSTGCLTFKFVSNGSVRDIGWVATVSCVTCPAPPANDNCSGATAFPAIPTNGTCANLNNQSTANATNSNVTPTGACTSNSGTPNDDVWFSFVATSAVQTITGTWVSGNTDVYWQVFSGACGSSMTSVLCTDNNTGGTVFGLTVGQTYYIRLYSWSGSGSTVQNICIQSPPPAPANDECTGAYPVTVSSGTACTSQTGGTVVGATPSSAAMGACSGTADDDVWYSFVATSTTHSVNITNVAGSVTDMYHSVYSGSCGTLGTALVCSDPNTSSISGLTVGQTYYVRVYTYSSTYGQTSTFSVCVTSPPPPPANDNCTGAYSVAVNSSSTACTSQTGGTLVGATASTYTNACGGTADDDVWYSFVATSTSHSITLNSLAGSTTDLYISVYGGSCGSPGAPLVCSDPESTNVGGLTIGNTYFIRIFSYTSTYGQTSTFSVCVNTPPPPPSNDNPCTATAAAVNSGTTCTVQTGGTVLGATASTVALGACFGTPDDDVWYSFVATNAIQNFSLTNVAGSATDMYFSVHGGTCGSIGTAFICSDPNNGTVTGLIVGQTYYVRVHLYFNG